MSSKYCGLRIDVCTLEGMRYGVPNLLKLFNQMGTRATFFLALGPDYSGRAIFNVFRPGFFSKMVRTNAVAIYGFRTMLYGTFLPAPIISQRCRSIIQDIKKDGHEIGIHSWNHRRWQDKLDSFSEEELRAEYDRANDRFKEILGYAPLCSAAPAWRTSSQSLRLQEQYSFSFASDCRGSSPFFPILNGQTLRTLQIPVTLPTFDEALGIEGITIDNYNEYIIQKINSQPCPVYVIHAEAEGRRYYPQCSALLKQLRTLNIEAGCLGAIQTFTKPTAAAIKYGHIPGRSGLITLQSGYSSS